MAPHRVKARSEYQKTEAGKAAVARARRKYVETNPIKRKAHIAVGNALRDGKLKPDNCEICGNPKAQAHHDDYSKPLDVRWLCTTHHAEWHKHNTPLCPDPGSSGMTTETSNARDAEVEALVAAAHRAEVSFNTVRGCYERNPGNFMLAMNELEADVLPLRAALAAFTGATP